MRVDAWARCGVMAILLTAWQAAAQAGDGLPSQAALNDMGLSGIRVMSDEDALAVRGQGAFAYGFSFAKVAGGGGQSGSTNGYFAHGRHKATGDNLSFAEVVKITKKKKSGHKPSKSGGKSTKHGGYGGGKPMVWSLGAYGGGSSFSRL